MQKPHRSSVWKRHHRYATIDSCDSKVALAFFLCKCIYIYININIKIVLANWVIRCYRSHLGTRFHSCQKTLEKASGFHIRLYGYFQKYGCFPQNGWWKSWKILLKWMIWRDFTHYFWFNTHMKIKGSKKALSSRWWFLKPTSWTRLWAWHRYVPGPSSLGAFLKP